MSTKTIYIARHGQTDFNLQGIVQGSGVDSSLNKTGRAQAAKLFDHYRHTPLDLVITSALQRTIQTANAFIDKPLPHKIYPAFNEIDWGYLEGIKPTPEHRKEFHRITKSWSQGDLDLKLEGGESPIDVQARMRPGIESLLAENASTLLLVSHGRAMRVLLCTMLDIPLSRMDEFPHTNTSVYQLEYGDGKFELIAKNNTEHLE